MWELENPEKSYCSKCGELKSTLTHWNEYTKAYKITIHECSCYGPFSQRNPAVIAMNEAIREHTRKRDLELLEMFKKINNC